MSVARRGVMSPSASAALTMSRSCPIASSELVGAASSGELDGLEVVAEVLRSDGFWLGRPPSPKAFAASRPTPMARNATAAQVAIFPTLSPPGRALTPSAPSVASGPYAGSTCVGDAWRAGCAARGGGTEADAGTRLEGRAALLIDRS